MFMFASRRGIFIIIQFMKKQILISAFTFLCLYSCSNENEDYNVTNDNNNNVDYSIPFSKTNPDEYDEFVKGLQLEFKDKTVYHDYNRPNYPENILKDLIENSIEEVQSNTDLKNLGSINGAAFGPYGDLGGHGGAAFDARLIINPEEKSKKLQAIRIKSGYFIDAIQLYWINEKNITSKSPLFGGKGGREAWLFLAPDEYITGVQVVYNWYVDNLTFITNYNVYTFGGSGGQYPNYANINFSISGYQMQGIWGTHGGKEGHYINQIGFYGYPNSLMN